MSTARLNRWRLILGKGASGALGDVPDAETRRRDEVLAWLYDREYGAARNIRREGSDDASSLTIPDWINAVHELFPKKTIERIEKDALERYQIEEMVTNLELLGRAQPSNTLLKAVLRTKHLMNQQVLALARQLVRRTVDELLDKLAREIRAPFSGAKDRRRRSLVKIASNFDAKTTIRRNLDQYDPEARRLVLRVPYFFSRVKRQVDRWQVIILVDQSGSMLDSVIHAAVTASIFFSIRTLRAHLCAFDTAVVDLTEDCGDPVETLMKVQLGGGTDIAKALAYASTLVHEPRRTIIVLISDLFEGGDPGQMLGLVKSLVESGVTFLGLAALDERAEPSYDRNIAKTIVRLGGHVGAMTPGELATWVAEKVR